MRLGVRIIAIPGPWYVTSRLTGPAERGTQPDGVWTGLAGAELGIHAGDPVNSSVLEYLVSRFGGFDVIIASDGRRSRQHAQALAARQARAYGDAVAAAQTRDQRASDAWPELK